MVIANISMAESNNSTSNLIAPFLWDDIANLSNWRDRIAWPISEVFSRFLGEATCREVLSSIQGLDDEFQQQVAKVAAGSFINGFVSLAEAAYVAQGEVQQGIKPLGGPPELAAIRDTAATVKVLQNRHHGKGIFDVRRSNYPLARSFARTASWSSSFMLPIMMLSPDTVVISHNLLLRQYARLSGNRARYWPAPNILVKARSYSPAKANSEISTNLTSHISDVLIPLAEGLSEPWLSRLCSLFEARLIPTVNRICDDLLAIRNISNLPLNIWTGSGSQYVARIIASEVMRRGGSVTGFDHGGVTAISQAQPLTAVGELMIADRFCVGTARWADLLKRSEALALVSPFDSCKVIHSNGEPTFRNACVNNVVRSRRRVLYVGHPYRALRQFAISGTPDVLYWDFQSRVAQYLSELSIDLTCKPHPEGHFVGQKNPIETIAPTSYLPFEDHLKDTDVFVFDAPTSTTFAEALCTNCPVVLLERGHYPFNPEIDNEIKNRCRIVPCQVDERNRIWPNLQILEDSICGDPATADPSFFRHLLADV